MTLSITQVNGENVVQLKRNVLKISLEVSKRDREGVWIMLRDNIFKDIVRLSILLMCVGSNVYTNMLIAFVTFIILSLDVAVLKVSKKQENSRLCYMRFAFVV